MLEKANYAVLRGGNRWHRFLLQDLQFFGKETVWLNSILYAL